MQHSKDWESQATCAQEPLNWFTSEQTEVHACRAICQSVCPVRRQCLETALHERHRFGVWGGVDEHELRRAMSIDATGNASVRSRLPRCPFCLSHELTVEGTRTRQGYLTTCTECNLEWRMATIPPPLRKKRKNAA